MTRQASISQKRRSTLFSKPFTHFVRTISATTIIPKLKPRLRRSHDRMPSSPVLKSISLHQLVH